MPSILVDSATRVLLAVSEYVPAIVFLNESMMDTYHVPRAERPSYRDGAFFKDLTPETFPNWTWNRGEREFKPTNPHVLTDELRTRARLASVKARHIGMMMSHISTVRAKVDRGIAGQEMVYLIKAGQAQRFRDHGYDEGMILECPYVLQYAEFSGISLKQAADDILIKASFDANYLLSTERLRLKYFALIKREDNPAVITGIFADFMAECYTNQAV